MKKILTTSLALSLFCSMSIAQNRTYSSDEVARLKASVDLITYDTIPTFENAAGEAYYGLVIKSFKENLSIPEFTFAPMTAADKAIVDHCINQLNSIKDAPPTWDDLLIRQTQYYIWLDKSQHKKSKYK